MQITTRQIEDVLVVDIAGKLETKTSVEAQEEMTRIAAHPASDSLVDELSTMRFSNPVLESSSLPQHTTIAKNSVDKALKVTARAQEQATEALEQTRVVRVVEARLRQQERIVQAAAGPDQSADVVAEERKLVSLRISLRRERQAAIRVRASAYATHVVSVPTRRAKLSSRCASSSSAPSRTRIRSGGASLVIRTRIAAGWTVASIRPSKCSVCST